MKKYDESYGIKDIRRIISEMNENSITHINFEEFQRDVDSINNMIWLKLSELEKKIIPFIERENEINSSLKKKLSKSVYDPELSEKTANEIKDIRQSKIEILEDMKEGLAILNNLNHVAQSKFSGALKLAKGAELSKELFHEQSKFVDKVYDRLESQRIKDNIRSDDMNKRQMEMFEYTMGQLIAKISILSMAKSSQNNPDIEREIELLKKDKKELSSKSFGYEERIQELEGKIEEIKKNAETSSKEVLKKDIINPEEAEDEVNRIESRKSMLINEIEHEKAVIEKEQSVSEGKEALIDGSLGVYESDKSESGDEAKKFMEKMHNERMYAVLYDYFKYGKDYDKVKKMYSIGKRFLDKYIKRAEKYGILSDFEVFVKKTEGEMLSGLGEPALKVTPEFDKEDE